MPRYANPAYGRYGTDPAWAQLGGTLATALFGDPQARAEQEQRQAEMDRLAAATDYDRERTMGVRFENDARSDWSDPTLNPLARLFVGPQPEAPTPVTGIQPVDIPPSMLAAPERLPEAMGMAAPVAPVMPSTGVPSVFIQGERPTRTVTTAAAPATGGDRSQPRGFRNNNPGNIMAGNYTQGRPGYAGSDGRFARFQSMEQGVAAMDGLLSNYMSGGRNTVRSIISRWAPSHENDTDGYIATIARAAGVSPDAPLTPASIPALRNAMIRVENGRALPASSSRIPVGSGGGAATTTTIGPTPLAQATVPDATYVPEPQGQAIDPQALVDATRLLVAMGIEDPAQIIATVSGYLGDDRAARGALISQGNSPSETFASTRERADNIATRDAQSELVRAIATGNLDQAGDTLRNDADNATTLTTNREDNQTSMANNAADNRTSRANNADDNATSRANNADDNASGGTTGTGRTRATNRDISAADVDMLQDQMKTLVDWDGATPARRARMMQVAQESYARGATPINAARDGVMSERGTPAPSRPAAPAARPAATANRVVNTPATVIRYDAQGNRIH